MINSKERWIIEEFALPFICARCPAILCVVRPEVIVFPRCIGFCGPPGDFPIAFAIPEEFEVGLI